MRDATINDMHQQNAKRNMLMLRQFAFLKTRQEAMEQVLLRSSFLKRLSYLWDVQRFFKTVDGTQMILLQKEQEKVIAAAEAQKVKSKIKVVRA